MVEQAHQERLEKAGFNHAGETFSGGGPGDVPPGGGPCGDPDCQCCPWWGRLAGLLLGAACRSVGLAAALAGQAVTAGEAAGRLREERDALAGDNEWLPAANRDLNAERNDTRTRTAPGRDRTSSGRRGRRPGCSPTITRRPSGIDRRETVDAARCRKGHRLSGRVSGSYTRVVKVTRILRENVEYAINRRRCHVCRKVVSARPPGVGKYARRSANHPATLTALHACGLSYGKAAGFSGDALKYTPYRAPRPTGTRCPTAGGWLRGATASPGTS